MKKVLSFMLMVVTYMQVHATLDQKNIFDTFNAKCEVLESVDGLSDRALPTEDECLVVESIIGEIPAILKQFYLTCGNRVLYGYDMAFLYKGSDSSLVKLFQKAKTVEWQVPSKYFPFCFDQDAMYCLDKDNGMVVVYEQFEKEIMEDPKYKWDSFLCWLQSVLVNSL